MRALRNLLLAGAAGIAIAGFSGMAHAGTPARQFLKTHVLTLQLPSGVTEQIIYTGSVAPAVRLGPLPAASMPAFPEFPAFLGSGSPFALMQRMAAKMDAELAQMLDETTVFANQPVAASAFGLQPGQMTRLLDGMFGPGAQGFSVVATTNGRGLCSEGYRITINGNGETRVVPFHAGDCGPQQATRSASPTISPPARTRAAPRMHAVLASAEHGHPPLKLVAWSR